MFFSLIRNKASNLLYVNNFLFFSLIMNKVTVNIFLLFRNYKYPLSHATNAQLPTARWLPLPLKSQNGKTTYPAGQTPLVPLLDQSPLTMADLNI